MKKVHVDFGCYNRGGREDTSTYNGMNPKFVQAVWDKRRKLAEEAAEREAQSLAVAEKAAADKAKADRQAEREALAKAAAQARDAKATEKKRQQAEKAIAIARQTQAEELAKIEKIMSLPGGMVAAKIIAEIALEYDLTYDDVVSPSRSKQAYAARVAAIAAVVKAFPQMSLPELGRTFSRHHASILHAMRGAGIVRATDEHSHKIAA